MDDCLKFWRDNFSSVFMNQKLPLGQLDSKLIQKLANTLTQAQLIEFGTKINEMGAKALIDNNEKLQFKNKEMLE